MPVNVTFNPQEWSSATAIPQSLNNILLNNILLNNINGSSNDTGLAFAPALTEVVEEEGGWTLGQTPWIPALVVAVGMLVLLSLSFFNHHRRVRRKREMLVDYLATLLYSGAFAGGRSVSVMCNTNSLSLSELGRSFKIKARETNHAPHGRHHHPRGVDCEAMSSADFLREKYMRDLVNFASSPVKKRRKFLKRFISAPLTEHKFRRVAGHMVTQSNVVRKFSRKTNDEDSDISAAEGAGVGGVNVGGGHNGGYGGGGALNRIKSVPIDGYDVFDPDVEIPGSLSEARSSITQGVLLNPDKMHPLEQMGHLGFSQSPSLPSNSPSCSFDFHHVGSMTSSSGAEHLRHQHTSLRNAHPYYRTNSDGYPFVGSSASSPGYNQSACGYSQAPSARFSSLGEHCSHPSRGDCTVTSYGQPECQRLYSQGEQFSNRYRFMANRIPNDSHGEHSSLSGRQLPNSQSLDVEYHMNSASGFTDEVISSLKNEVIPEHPGSIHHASVSTIVTKGSYISSDTSSSCRHSGSSSKTVRSAGDANVQDLDMSITSAVMNAVPVSSKLNPACRPASRTLQHSPRVVEIADENLSFNSSIGSDHKGSECVTQNSVQNVQKENDTRQRAQLKRHVLFACSEDTTQTEQEERVVGECKNGGSWPAPPSLNRTRYPEQHNGITNTDKNARTFQLSNNTSRYKDSNNRERFYDNDFPHDGDPSSQTVLHAENPSPQSENYSRHSMLQGRDTPPRDDDLAYADDDRSLTDEQQTKSRVSEHLSKRFPHRHFYWQSPILTRSPRSGRTSPAGGNKPLLSGSPIGSESSLQINKPPLGKESLWRKMSHPGNQSSVISQPPGRTSAVGQDGLDIPDVGNRESALPLDVLSVERGEVGERSKVHRLPRFQVRSGASHQHRKLLDNPGDLQKVVTNADALQEQDDEMTVWISKAEDTTV